MDLINIVLLLLALALGALAVVFRSQGVKRSDAALKELEAARREAQNLLDSAKTEVRNQLDLARA
ncbi:MAG: hypothetical protein M1157_01670, partial [Deinococcus sp.]|nr:hypothetical protein [Deinococcus sp.]